MYQSSRSLIDPFLRALGRAPAVGVSDGQLLERFLGQRDEAAFTELVRRHGRMVIGVCQRILGSEDGVEDAFQATFIVLVRKARSLAGRSVLGGWLHGVARRLALKARFRAAQRRQREQALARDEAPVEAARNDWLPLLDEALGRLPEKYRLPLVLCDLEERTRQEAAAQLGWPEGTVAGRLARGREMLAQRLLRSARHLVGTLPPLAGAALPSALEAATVRAAVYLVSGQPAHGVLSAASLDLAEGVLQSMRMNKLKIIAVVLVVAVCGLGGAAYAFSRAADDGPVPTAQPKGKVVSNPANNTAQPKPDADPLAGPGAGEPKLDGLAVVAEPAMGKDCQFLRLYLENTTDKAIDVAEQFLPGFTADTWFNFKVNGKPLGIIMRGSHSGFPGSPEKRTLSPKSKTYFGAAVLRQFGKPELGGYTPVLNLKPGQYAFEISSKPGIKPAKLNITVAAKAGTPDPVPKQPLLLALSQATHERNAQFIVIHLLNQSDQQFELPHDGEEPPWHTAPWFDLEVDGKPFKPKVPAVEVPAEKGNMTIEPLEHRYRGELLIPLEGMDKKFFDHNHYYTPVLPLPPGAHKIRVLPSKRWSQPGITPPLPATIDVVVPALKKPKEN